MLQKLLLTMAFFMILGGQAQALDQFHRYIMTVGGLDSNGDDYNFGTDYNQGVSLFDDSDPISPEIKFNVNDNHGKLELEFD